MRILLTNNTLGVRAGTELYLCDVALELLRRGHHPIAFSTVHGEVAEQLRAATIPVISNLDDCGAPPDIIHGQHHFETLITSLYFPDTPVVNFCHGWAPAEEEPLISPKVLRYVAVDDTTRDRLIYTSGIDPVRITVLLNFVDTERFERRPPLPAKPKRALAFGNYFSKAQEFAIETACRNSGIELDKIGLSSNHAVSDPESILPGYDLVFAKGRAALESMAVGTAVMLVGPRGFGPLVTATNWPDLRRMNFGIRTHNLPARAETVADQIALYDPKDAAAVCDLVRSQARLADTVDELLRLYEAVIEEGRSGRTTDHEAQRAASRHLNRYASTFKAFGPEYFRSRSNREARTRAAFGSLIKGVGIGIATMDGEAVGSIDSAVRRYGVMKVTGWVAHRPSNAPCRAILFLQKGECAGIGFSEVRRADVSEHLGTNEACFGFDIQFDVDDGPVQVVAVTPAGGLFDLAALAAPEASRVLDGISEALARVH
jgi:Glycosyltransferase Family 4